MPLNLCKGLDPGQQELGYPQLRGSKDTFSNAGLNFPMLNFVRKGRFRDCEIVRCTSNAIELVPLDRLQPSCTRPWINCKPVYQSQNFHIQYKLGPNSEILFQQFHFTCKQRLSANCLDFLMVGILHLSNRKASPRSTTLDSEPSPLEKCMQWFQILWFDKPALQLHYSLLHSFIIGLIRRVPIFNFTPISFS